MPWWRSRPVPCHAMMALALCCAICSSGARSVLFCVPFDTSMARAPPPLVPLRAEKTDVPLWFHFLWTRQMCPSLHSTLCGLDRCTGCAFLVGQTKEAQAGSAASRPFAPTHTLCRPMFERASEGLRLSAPICCCTRNGTLTCA